MSRFALLKLVRTVVTLWLVVTFAFIVLRTSGDPVQSLLTPDATQEELDYFRTLWGLDRPIWDQYLAYVWNVVQGEFGTSYRDGRTVVAIVVERVPATLLLGAVGLGLAILVGVPLGIMAAVHRNRLIDRAAMAFAVFGFAVPNFFFGIVLILTFSLWLRILPSSGSGTIWHLIMPSVTLGLAIAGALARFTRSSMLDVLSKTYMQTAVAKGVPPLKRLFGHALPNAAIPMVTILGFSIEVAIAGAIVIETVFAWPGVGRLLVASVTARDLAVVQALVLMIAAAMIVINLTIDLLYGVLDPRIRVASVEG